MDLMSFGADVGVVAGIIALSQIIKKLIPEKYKKYLVIVPLILYILISFVITQPLEIQTYFKNVIIYTGAASWIYNGRKIIRPNVS